MVTTDQLESQKIEKEILELVREVGSLDENREKRNERFAAFERDLEELYVEQTLDPSGDTQKKIDRLLAKIERLRSESSNRRQGLLKGITKRQMQFKDAKESERASDAVCGATEMLPTISEIEDRLIEAGTAIQTALADLNRIYGAAIDA